MPHLPGILASLAPVLAHYGYLVVFGLVFVERLDPPCRGRAS